MYNGFWPATILNYDAATRTAQVDIAGLTEGLDEGLTADFAWPVGDDDADTERQILANADVWVFFEQGHDHAPVIAFFRSHREGALVDIRRIRQKNIELLANSRVLVKAPQILIEGTVRIKGDVIHEGNQTTTGTINATEDIKAGNISLKGHSHSGVKGGPDTSGGPVAG